MYISPPRDILKNNPKIAVVTGAAQGIGTEIARLFIKKGYVVVLVDFNQEAGLEQEKKLGEAARFYRCDLSDSAQIESLCDSIKRDFKTIDVIIHNARGPAKERDLLQNLEREWDHTIRVMLKHPILMNQLLLESLKNSTNPSILFIGSTNGRFVSQQPLSYHVIKGALFQTIRYLACEYGKHKIRVNLLNPGIVDIPGRVRKNPELFQKTVECVIPLQRTALAEEVASSCLFLASDEAKYLTGVALDLDGGEHIMDHFHLMMTQMLSEAKQVSGTLS